MVKVARQPRFLDRHGHFNVLRRGVPKAFWYDLYHWLVTLKWRYFLLLVACVYLGVNALFALLYLWGGAHLNGAKVGSFWDAFFFSVQTFSTIGYGALTPATSWANAVVAAEALCGMAITAMVTGLTFSKFSLPTARVIFSHHAIIRDFEGKRVLMFRMANIRGNQIVDAKLHVFLVRTVYLPDGEMFRKMTDLPLSRHHSSMFVLSWTAMHELDVHSPLYQQDAASWREQECEIVIALSGTDGTFGQAIQARHSYTIDEVVFDHRFVDIMGREHGKVILDMTHFHETAPLNTLGQGPATW